MDTESFTPASETAAVDRWTALAPAAVILPAESRSEFLETASYGTLIEAYGDLYRATGSGGWSALEDLVSDGAYYNTSDYGRISAADFARDFDTAAIRVLRIGPGSW